MFSPIFGQMGRDTDTRINFPSMMQKIFGPAQEKEDIDTSIYANESIFPTYETNDNWDFDDFQFEKPTDILSLWDSPQDDFESVEF